MVRTGTGAGHGGLAPDYHRAQRVVFRANVVGRDFVTLWLIADPS
ncbi:hypothetical protein RKLH11_3642 [Rhodobacteraceae bacterium KLH11]|nr:hypothetical protein RKLH11_3642 [Rhodobacteraceae bacterium KLH11]